jgi:tetratricopeptide (TPR) repeat protein
VYHAARHTGSASAHDIRYDGVMAARHLGRIAAWGAGGSAWPVVLGGALGRSGIAIGAGIAIAATAWLLVWLPRVAHRAFERARYPVSARRYRLIAALAFTPVRERAALLSWAGCAAAAGRHAAAERTLARFDGAALDPSERVTWLNNRACVALETGRDPHGALALVDEAAALRPDVPAVQHTRAVALIALGRFDDAIAILDAMRAAGELTPALEAMRCRELAKAWEHKGQPDYAADYRDRARLVVR